MRSKQLRRPNSPGDTEALGEETTAQGVRLSFDDKTMLTISGTAGADEAGLTKPGGNFRAPLWRTYRNITPILHPGSAATSCAPLAAGEARDGMTRLRLEGAQPSCRRGGEDLPVEPRR